MKNKVQFQTKNFNFPESAYIACITLIDSTGHKHNACLTRVFENLDILKRYVLFVINDLTKSNAGFDFSYKGHLIKIKKDRFFPLQKSHWQKKKKDFNLLSAQYRNDVNIIKYWEMSELLVTPDGETNGLEFFSFCFSLFKNTQKSEIDFLIKNSEQSVDTRAKNAAFYILEKPVKINWLEGDQKTIVNRWVENYTN